MHVERGGAGVWVQRRPALVTGRGNQVQVSRMSLPPPGTGAGGLSAFLVLPYWLRWPEGIESFKEEDSGVRWGEQKNVHGP